MSSFVSIISPITGKMEWQLQNDDYDYHQEVARSSYADMLHDTERNKKYNEAIRIAIDEIHRRGHESFVLDIGTGTGLLAMMAARHGANKIVACEAFRPIAECAQRVIKLNNLKDKIKVIHKRSTELTESEMGGRANILVAEVFDTELIGEGALRTFHHAKQNLLQDDCIVIPSSSKIFIQVASHPNIQNFNSFYPVQIWNNKEEYINTFSNQHFSSNDSNFAPLLTINPPQEATKCAGLPSVHDLQLSRIFRDGVKAVTDPFEIFEFDFCESKKPLRFSDCQIFPVVSKTKLENNDNDNIIIFFWWDLKMDFKGDIHLSTAPIWAHPDRFEIQWRDHWMQAVYYPQSDNVFQLKSEEKFYVKASHDQFSFSFDLKKDEYKEIDRILSPVCSCGYHLLFSRTRLFALNNRDTYTDYSRALKKVICLNTVAFYIGDESYVPIIAANFGAQVYLAMTNEMSIKFMKDLILTNHLEGKIKIINKNYEDITLPDLDEKLITLFVCEPYFSSSHLPWHNLQFTYISSLLVKNQLTQEQSQSNGLQVLQSNPKKHNNFCSQSESNLYDEQTGLGHEVQSNCSQSETYELNLNQSFSKNLVEYFPNEIVIFAMAMEFINLQKIRQRVGTCEGFNIQPFDELIETSSDITDSYAEPHPLWEYEGIALSHPFPIFHSKWKCLEARSIEREGFGQFDWPGTCNGFAIWSEFKFKNKVINKHGPIIQPIPGKQVSWSRANRQAVHLLKTPVFIGYHDNLQNIVQNNLHYKNFDDKIYDLNENNNQVDEKKKLIIELLLDLNNKNNFKNENENTLLHAKSDVCDNILLNKNKEKETDNDSIIQIERELITEDDILCLKKQGMLDENYCEEIKICKTNKSENIENLNNWSICHKVTFKPNDGDFKIFFEIKNMDKYSHYFYKMQ